MNNKFFYTLITISLLILLFPIRIYAESDMKETTFSVILPIIEQA